jgi:hypothetical protein
MLLGVGGIRLLDALGVEPEVYHFNEGHAVFAGIELLVRIGLRELGDRPERLRTGLGLRARAGGVHDPHPGRGRQRSARPGPA